MAAEELREVLPMLITLEEKAFLESERIRFPTEEELDALARQGIKRSRARAIGALWGVGLFGVLVGAFGAAGAIKLWVRRRKIYEMSRDKPATIVRSLGFPVTKKRVTAMNELLKRIRKRGFHMKK